MNQEEIRGLLNQPYNSENWKKIAKDIFPDAHIYAEPKQLLLPDNKQIDIIYTIGEVRLHSGEILLLYEVKVKHNVNIYRSRVALREALAKTIDYEKSNGVLVVYEQGRDDYRFTFAAKEVTIDPQTGNSIVRETDKKRFTYILGKNEKCRTAASRFYDIKKRQANGEEINLQSVIDTFNVGKLNDEFFADYRKIYGNFTKAITGYDEDQKGDGQLMQSFEQYFGGIDDLARKNARDFVKKMMGRIVFLYFVQKKGWMGVPKGEKWGDGDLDFMKHLFDATNDKNSFYKNVLEPLFYKNLNAERSDDIFDISPNLFSAGFADNIRIPYLNGGLFSNDMPTTNGFQFPQESSLFCELFNFLDKYNFTIDENSDQEQTVAIDPEMLGRVFENLLEDNRENGTYYTPREIVHYMCRQSLAEYLTTTLENKHSIKDTQLKEKMENFVVNNDASEIKMDWVKPLALALREVKVCDPAIGSGAFPMGMLREILEALNTLASIEEQTVRKVWNIEGDYSDNYARIKEQIIQNSIYGVDIEKGAVDIARLRFWLSLIVEEHEPKPLPNLDYKIVVGNSLISLLNGVPLEIDWNINAFAGGQKLKERILESIKTLNQLQSDFFFAGANMPGLALKIRNAKIQLLTDQIELNKQVYVNKNSNQIKIDLTPTLKEIKKRQENQIKIAQYDQQLHRLKALTAINNEDLNFFDWKLDFPEVLNTNVTSKFGFDIIIGNPPFVDYRKIDNNTKQGLSKYEISKHSKKINLYVYFFEIGLNILKKGGVLSYISPQQYLASENCKGLRDFIRNKSILFLSDFAEIKLFKASTYNFVSTIKNLKNNNPGIYIKFQKVDNQIIPTKKLLVKNPLDEPYSASEELELLEKIESCCSQRLGQFIDVFCASSKTTVVKNSKGGKFSFNYIQASDILEYNILFKDNYISLEGYSGTAYRKQCQEVIYVSRLTNNIRAAILNDNNSLGGKVNVCYSIDSTLNNKIIMALLNSKTVNYWYREKYNILHMGGGALPINTSEIEKVPLPNLANNLNTLNLLVDEVLSLLKDNGNIMPVKEKIDIILYKMYELNYEDVIKIDPAITLNQEDYDSFVI